jgi:hypothetical protein
MTARNIGAMYTVEFVESCLKHASPWVAENTYELAVLKQHAAEVAGTLFNLVILAKTRTRTAVMKTRKKLDIAAVYGKRMNSHCLNNIVYARCAGERPTERPLTEREEAADNEYYDDNFVQSIAQQSEAEAFKINPSAPTAQA